MSCHKVELIIKLKYNSVNIIAFKNKNVYVN